MTDKVSSLTEEQRLTVNLVAEILLDLRRWDSSGKKTVSEIDRMSVQLRKLLLNAGAGSYGPAWSLLGLPGQPMVKASDLDAALRQSQPASQALIWIEAPIAWPKARGFEAVTDSSKFVPLGLREPKICFGEAEPYLYSEVTSADGAIYFWGYVPRTGSVVATKFEPSLELARPPEVIVGELAEFRRMTFDLGKEFVRNFTLSELRRSTAVAAGEQRMTRQNAIGFVANRRGAHIDTGVHTSFKRERDALRELQYTGLREVPSWVDQLQTVFVQVRSIGQYIGASPDAERYLSHWTTLAQVSPYWNP